MEKVIRAIDVGYGNTKFTKSQLGNGEYEYGWFPSFSPKAPRQDLSGGLSGSRDTKVVEVNSVLYEVGPDAALAAGTRNKRVLHEDYINQPQYMALTKGALSYMGLNHIDILVLGLPVNFIDAKKDALIDMMEGEHNLANGVKCHVETVVVVPQPLGGLFSFMGGSQDKNLFDSLKRDRNLIVDPGYLTFDFLYSDGFKPNTARSDADPSGMSRIISAVAEEVGKNLEVADYDDYETVDRGLRNGTERIYGQEHDFGQYRDAWMAVARDAVSTMKNKIGDGRDVDRIVVCGGGAHFYVDALKEAYPKHAGGIMVVEQNLLSNVKGFQHIGKIKAQMAN